MIERTLFTPEHQVFRDSLRRFMAREIAPFPDQWEEQGYVARELWSKAGANSFLCMSLPEQYGGAGADLLYSVIQFEELAATATCGSTRSRAPTPTRVCSASTAAPTRS